MKSRDGMICNGGFRMTGGVLRLFILRCLSGALLGGLAGYWITRALYRTGALSGLRIDRDWREARA